MVTAHSVLNGGAVLKETTKKPAELICDEMTERIVQAAAQIATEEGTDAITVRRLLGALGITNRVFYNRFHNAEEVLEAVHRSMSEQIRRDILPAYDGESDFFEYVMDVVEKSLVISYETKMRFNPFAFESDSVSASNCEWWTGQIKSLIDYAAAHDLIREVDSAVMSYSIWCFCRGYNADAVARGLPRDEAVQNFRYSFGFLLEGMKK